MVDEKLSIKNLIEIFSIASIAFIGILMTTAVNVIFPLLGRYFSMPLSQIQWFSTGGLITSAIVMICSAYMDCRFNDKVVFVIGTVALLMSLFICAIATNYYLFLFGRILDGVCVGTSVPLMFNVIPRLVPQDKIGFYMATGATTVSIGPSLGPTYGGIVNDYVNWRMIFVIVLPLTLIIMVVGLLNIVNRIPNRKNSRMDLLGFVWIVIAFVTLTLGLNSLTNFSGFTILMLAVGVFTMCIFLYHGSHRKQPILNTRVLKYPKFTFNLVAYFLIQLANISLSTIFIPTFSQVALGTTSMIAGLSLLPGNALYIVGLPFGGSMLDKYGAKLPIYSGLGLITVYFVIMFMFNDGLTVTAIWLIYIIFNVGLALSYSNILTDSLQALPLRLRNDGNAVLNAVQVYGGAVGVCMLSLILSLYDENHSGITKSIAVREGSKWCSLTLLIIIVVSIGLLYLGTKHDDSASSNEAND